MNATETRRDFVGHMASGLGGIALASLLLPCANAMAADGAGEAFFESNIRPLLVEKCLECHGEKKQKGGLRLDSKSGWQKGGETGPALIPGKPDESLLIEAISWKNEERRMPPKTRLPDTAVADLKRWVAMGAPDPREARAAAARKTVSPEEGRRLWAFQPLRRPPVPAVRATNWARSDIDRFILARLEDKGLRPNPPLDRRKWIRRVTLDLIGLPPAPEEIAAFLQDTAPDAESRVIDRLLDSPHYGERWGRHWLDLARWAESAGYENDNDRPHAWHYRDFVIRAFNEDLPYDTFVQWQIAGDEIAPGHPEAEMATGFLAAGPMNGQVTQREAEKERYDVLDDWVTTIGTSMLGLTLGCARCHDHKFDPVPTRDYYALVSALSRTVRANRNVVTDPQTAQREGWKRAHERLIETRAHYEREELARRRDLPAKSLALPGSLWVVCTPEKITPGGDQAAVTTRFTQREDSASRIVEANGEIASYSVEFRTPLRDLKALRLEVLPDESLPNSGPGLGDFGEFQMNAFSVSATPATGGPPVRVAFATTRDTLKKIAGGSWGFRPENRQPQSALFEFKEPVGGATGTVFTVVMRFDGDNPGGRKALGCFRISAAVGDGAADFDSSEILHDAFVASRLALDRPAIERTPAGQGALVEVAARFDPEWQWLDRAVRSSWAARPWPRYEVALVTTEATELVPQRLKVQGPDFYEKAFVLKRGNPELKQEEVAPGFLHVLYRAPDAPVRWQPSRSTGTRTSGQRSALARWLTDVEAGGGPLLARVMVNRLWQHHFGRGIVSTPSDFGAQGDPPTHPELLDWLASELVARRWSLKALHRLILSSAVYAQGIENDPERARVDPENRLWWRRPLVRLESEVIRDSMLAVSGRLDKKAFGPGTLDEANARRSIYFRVKRSQLIPSLTQLDWPDTLGGLGKRPVTTVAPQALLMLNGPQVRATAEAFAQRLTLAFAQSPRAAVQEAYRLALGRDPGSRETEAAIAFLDQQARSYASDKAQPSALADFCQTLFSLNEFFYSP